MWLRKNWWLKVVILMNLFELCDIYMSMSKQFYGPFLYLQYLFSTFWHVLKPNSVYLSSAKEENSTLSLPLCHSPLIHLSHMTNCRCMFDCLIGCLIYWLISQLIELIYLIDWFLAGARILLFVTHRLYAGRSTHWLFVELFIHLLAH